MLFGLGKNEENLLRNALAASKLENVRLSRELQKSSEGVTTLKSDLEQARERLAINQRVEQNLIAFGESFAAVQASQVKVASAMSEE